MYKYAYKHVKVTTQSSLFISIHIHRINIYCMPTMFKEETKIHLYSGSYISSERRLNISKQTYNVPGDDKAIRKLGVGKRMENQ